MSEHNKTFEISINGTPKTVDHDTLDYDEVVLLAFPDRNPETIYSVTFENGVQPKDGELVAGQSVKIHKGEGNKHTEFDVEDTGRS
jgi:hypothetical protein